MSYMDHQLKAFVIDSYAEFLNGAEVRAGIIGKTDHPPAAGERIMVYKHSIAAETSVPVPRAQQSHYIGVEGTITRVVNEKAGSTGHHPVLKVKKV